MDFNPIDLLLATLLLLGAALGWRRGFLLEFLDLAAWLAALLAAFACYPAASRWIAGATRWPEVWSRPLGFFAVFFPALILLRTAGASLAARMPAAAHRHAANRVLGILPGLADGAIQAIVIATLLLAAPLPPRLQDAARDSALGNRFAAVAERMETALQPVFGAAIQETLNMLTVKPESTETVRLRFTVADATPRPALEARMLEMVNRERSAAGLRPLLADERLTAVARQYSADMLARGYFSHYSPEKKTLSDRLRAQKIAYLVAGENLAFAPTLAIAHNGLMHSPGHRANILRPQFRRVGIGIMDAGVYGIMVTQEFSN